MARYVGPICRYCRRESIKLFLKGTRCLTDKCAVERRSYVPGQHGQNKSRRRASEYSRQLREKQKLKRIYGLLERQFVFTFEKAERLKGMTGDNLVSLLERRLDNVTYRLGLATSRKAGRQLVNHGHIMVNGRKVDIPSFLVHQGDVIEVRPLHITRRESHDEGCCPTSSQIPAPMVPRQSYRTVVSGYLVQSQFSQGR